MNNQKITANDILELYEGVCFANSIGKRFNIYLKIKWNKMALNNSPLSEADKAYTFYKAFKTSCLESFYKDNNMKPSPPYIMTFSNPSYMGLCTHLLLSDTPINKLKKRMKLYLSKAGKGHFSFEIEEISTIKKQWDYFKEMTQYYEPDATIQDTDGRSKPFSQAFGDSKNSENIIGKNIKLYASATSIKKKKRENFSSRFYTEPLDKLTPNNLFTDFYYNSFLADSRYEDHFSLTEALELCSE